MHHKIAFEYSRATSIRFQTNLMRNMKYESCKRYAANICTCIQTCQYLSCRKVTNIEVLKCLCTKCIFFCAGTNVIQKGQRFSERNYHFLYIVYWTFLTTFLTMLTFHILKPSFSSFDMISLILLLLLLQSVGGVAVYSQVVLTSSSWGLKDKSVISTFDVRKYVK